MCANKWLMLNCHCYITMVITCFNQRGDISTLNGNSLNKFTYLGSSVSSTEKDIKTRLAKALTAIDWLSVIWRSDLTEKMKPSFFPSSGRIDTVVWMHYIDVNYMDGEKAWPQLHKNAESNIKQVLEAAPHKTAAGRPLISHHENSPI